MNRTKRLVVQAAVAACGLTASIASAAATWNGSEGMGSAWSAAANWTDGLPADNDVIFNDLGAAADAATVTNVVDADVTSLSLRYANVSPAFHHTQIPTGVTLSLAGGGSMLYVGTGTDLGSAATVQGNISGGGTFSLNNTAGDMVIRQTSATSGGTKRATLDMSGLSAFNANIRNLQVGVGTSNTGGMGRATGTLLLANNNQITANSIVVSSNPSSGGGLQSRIYLGQTNTIHTHSITVAGGLGNGRLDYQNGITGGTLVLRGGNGIGRANLSIGVQPLSGGPNGTATGVMDLTAGTGTGGGSIDAQVDELLLGRSGNSLSFGGNGTLTYDSGVINANTVIIGQQAPNAAGSNPTSRGTGTVNARGGVLVVNGDMTLGMVKADFTNSSTAGGTGNLNVSNNAAVRVAGAVNDGTLASSVATGISNIVVDTGGSLRSARLGAAAAPIDTFTLDGGVLGVDLAAGGAPASAWGHIEGFTANGANTIQLHASGGLAAGTFTALSFETLAGAGFSTFTLDKLPARVTATLVDGTNGAGPGTIGINVTSADQPRWAGVAGGGTAAWDINNSLNWKLLNGGTPTTYQEDLVTYATTDTVLFNDDAAGRDVNVAATVAPNGILIDTALAYTFTGSGAITGGGGLVKRGDGSATLGNTGGNSFAGPIGIEKGTLVAGAAGVLPSAAIVTIAAGATLEVGETAQTVGQINLNGANLASAPGGTITAHQINTTDGTITANIAGNTEVNIISGNLVMSGDNTFTPALEIPDGSNLLITSNNALGAPTGQTGLAGGANTGSLQLSGGINSPESLLFRGRQTNVNFTPHVENVSGNNTLSGEINFTTGGGWYNIQSSAGKLTIAGDIVNPNASRNLFLRGAGDGEISGAYRDVDAGSGNLIKEDAGTWTLSGNNAYVGNTTVNGGKLVFAQSFNSSAALTVAGGATAAVAPAGTTVLGFDTVTVNGQLDLADNKLITASPVGTWTGSAYDGVSGLVDSGRGDTPTWSGSGIVTSDARAQNSNLVSIGVAKAGQVKGITDTDTATFAGQTVLGSDTLAMVTWGGDATLDGKINIDDYGRIDANVASSGSVFGWYNGDFNYDGAINIDDYGIIDGNISGQGTAFPTAAVAAEGVSAVPEPASLSVLALGALGLMRRRRGN